MSKQNKEPNYTTSADGIKTFDDINFIINYLDITFKDFEENEDHFTDKFFLESDYPLFKE